MFNLAQCRRITFIALMAMVMLALAPTITKVIASYGVKSNLVEVCTTEGTKWLSTSEIDSGQGGFVTAEKPGPAQAHDHGSDCSYCHLQLAKFLPSTVQSHTATKMVALLPPLFYEAHTPLFIWANQSARAPPSES